MVHHIIAMIASSSLPESIIGPELATLSDLPYQTIHYYTVEGILAATEQAADGRGSRRLYGFNDAVAACVVARLRRYGSSLDQLRQVGALVRSISESDMLAASRNVMAEQVSLLLSSDGSVRLIEEDLPVQSTLVAYGLTDGLFLNLSEIAATVKDRLTEMRLRGRRRVPKRAAKAGRGRK